MKSNRVMAVDYGTKRIGLALSDELRMLATPIGIIETTNRAHKDIAELAVEKAAGTVILGLPSLVGGGDSEWTLEVRKFGKQLEAELAKKEIDFAFYDEKFTSVIAEYNIRAQELSKRKHREKSRRDEEAARILLQEWLDRK
jgi:putative Holliday junction resolvase